MQQAGATNDFDQPSAAKNSLAYFSIVASTLFMGIAWWYPESMLAAGCGWASTLFLVYAAQLCRARYIVMYFGGVLFQPLGFYWLYCHEPF